MRDKAKNLTAVSICPFGSRFALVNQWCVLDAIRANNFGLWVMRKIRAENLTETAIRTALATADNAMIVDQFGKPLSVLVSVDQFNLMASSCQLFSSVRSAGVKGGGQTSSSEPHTRDLFK